MSRCSDSKHSTVNTFKVPLLSAFLSWKIALATPAQNVKIDQSVFTYSSPAIGWRGGYLYRVSRENHAEAERDMYVPITIGEAGETP